MIVLPLEGESDLKPTSLLIVNLFYFTIRCFKNRGGPSPNLNCDDLRIHNDRAGDIHLQYEL